MSDSCLTNLFCLPKYLIVELNYDVVKVEELLYEMDSSVQQEELLGFLVLVLKHKVYTMRDTYVEIHRYFKNLSKVNGENNFLEHYQELASIFVRFALEVKSTIAINGLLNELDRYSYFLSKGLTNLVIIETSKTPLFENGNFIQLCDFGDGASIPGIQ